MELSARVTALEEEVGMLKGEIKAILQEVRVAVLARQNPFLEDFGEGVQASQSVSLFAPDEPAPAHPPAQVTAARPMALSEAAPSEEPADPGPALHPSGSSSRPLDLAALLSWVQQTTHRHSKGDFGLLLSMAAYGELIDAELKQTLLELSERLPSDEAQAASLADFTLALQQLAALREHASGGQTRRHNAA